MRDADFTCRLEISADAPVWRIISFRCGAGADDVIVLPHFGPIDTIYFSVAIIFSLLVFIVFLSQRLVASHVDFDRRVFGMIYISLVAAALAVFLVVLLSQGELAGPLTILFGALLATLGWIITNILNRRQNKIQHTSRFIEHFTDDPQCLYHNTVMKHCAPSGVLTFAQAQRLLGESRNAYLYDFDDLRVKGAPLMFSVGYIFNRYEMIALHYYDDTVDRDLIRRYFNSSISPHITKYQNLIRTVRRAEKDAAPQDKPAPVKTWNELVRLSREWFDVDLDSDTQFALPDLKQNYLQKYERDYRPGS